jgi:hypothetical protein
MAKDQRDAVAEKASSGPRAILPRSGLLELETRSDPLATPEEGFNYASFLIGQIGRERRLERWRVGGGIRPRPGAQVILGSAP